MKKLFLFIFYITVQLAFSQYAGDVKIDWRDGKYPYYDNNTLDIPWFDSENFVYKEGKIFFVKKIETDGYVNEGSLQITNTIFENVPARLVSQLKGIPNSIEAFAENSIARDVFSTVVQLSPIIKDGNSYKRIKSFSYSFITSGNSPFLQNNKFSNGIIHSVLATGMWKKFYIEKSGVYKITKAFLKDIGFNVNVDPRTIKIYGNGGRMIPLLNSVPYPNDLAENAISFVGEQDGIFDENDYILFYGEGIDNWNDDSGTFNNLYADRSYYYVTSSASTSKRITPIIEPTAGATTTFTTFDKFQYYEVDKINIGKTGRRWFGDSFNINNTQNFSFDFPNLDTSQQLNTEIVAAGSKVLNSSLNINCNGQNIGNLYFHTDANQPSSPGTFNTHYGNYYFNTSSPTINVKLSYNNAGVPTANAFLDYIKFEGKCFLKGYGKQFHFRIKDANFVTGVAAYQFTNASSISEIWDISDIYNITSKTNNGLGSFDLKANLGTASKYIALDTSDFYTPIKDNDSAVVNQDLKGTLFLNDQGVFQDIDYLIVAPQFLYFQAKKLADFHKQRSNLNVKVVTLENIYPEFSSGKQDIGAIRNMVKYVYENASSPSKRIKYLCLFGDASYDYKNRTTNNTNIVPIYAAREGFDSSPSTYITDDFYGLMDNNEGNFSSFIGIDIAVGRILASNTTQAEQMITKFFEYHNKDSFGKWRSNIVMVADDLDEDGEDRKIQETINAVADNLILNKPFFNVKKVIMDSYLQQVTSGGEKYPKVNEEFINAFQQGSLVVSYLGHGGHSGLAQERVFGSNDAVNLKNQSRYPLFLSLGCEVTPFDKPASTSLGEYTFFNPTGGAIALITTNREIGKDDAYTFNKDLSQFLYAFGSNKKVSIAEAVRLTKNRNSHGYNVISMIGDPALELAIPKPKVVLTKINDTPISNSTTVLQALSHIKVSGEVVDENNVLLNNYDGDVSVTIFDKDITKTTLANDGAQVIDYYIHNPPNNPIPVYKTVYLTFKDSGEKIFRGNASVAKGKFELSFTVPRDIQIPLGNGKISMYAKNITTPEDQQGSEVIQIGGSNPNAVADTTPPQVKIFLNTESFVSGGNTNQSPLFFAHLEDEHGINTASGIGHDIVAILDGNESNPYILNEYYETELNNSSKGKIKFPFKNLSLGLHTLTFRAWDTYNNPIKAELQFVVVGDEDITLSNVLNYPNPFVNHTEFWFNHNKPFEPLEVQVQVMTITGKIVWTKNQTVATDGFLCREITWDGKDDFGDSIGKGIYIYKLTVKSSLTNKTSEKIEKLVIL